MQNLYSINPRSRHNLPPHLEIITFNFPKVFQNFKTIEKKSQRSEGPPPLLFTIKFNLFLKFSKPGVYNLKRNLARSCFVLIYI